MRYERSGENKLRGAFASGFLTGLTAPALLLSGAFEVVTLHRSSSMTRAWTNVGQLIRSSAEHYKRQSDGRSNPRRDAA